MGSISLREFIRWHPDEASEPTSTIVVTSPQRRFVDLRILRPEGVQGPWPTQLEKLPTEQLEWGIAGTSSSWKRDDGVTRSQWQHWIDSRTHQPENATDEGDMFPQADGTTLEKGSMVNPATGKETAYEELWRDVDPTPTTSSEARTIVLQVEIEELRGSVVRLGQYCQGILKEGDKITAERWEWNEVWKQTVRMGEDTLPCRDVLDDERELKLGDIVAVGGRGWRVVEVS
ncbi:Fc.00g032380.m01.CDS01 [Cosmosporella sp. VM-42]